MAEKFIVKLTAEERQTLTQLTTTGRTAAARLRHAGLLLKTAAAAPDGGWTDDRSAAACDARRSTFASPAGDSGRRASTSGPTATP